MNKKFQRTIENFVCEHCGTEVTGDGYTDHCPVCLWGKHVDVNPGDRAANCGGAMEPVDVSIKSQVYRIEYRCQGCGHKFTVKADDKDDINKIIELSTNPK
jgi:DNA-directed RNA polymerase subunit RPC12/RpoP